ncbi:MAG: DUF364 domain-containing protein [Dehalococcoidia bacterium]|nr:DUF364 domain-containing protein [Dehalococcoidia bacterium]
MTTEVQTKSGILGELTDTLRYAVRGIPEKLSVVDIRIGIYYTAVKLNSGHAGVAYTPTHEIPQSRCCPLSQSRMKGAGQLLDLCLFEHIDLAHSENLLESAVGVATINAVSSLLLEGIRPGFRLLGDEVDTLSLLKVGEQDTVSIVGAFPPVIKHMRQFTKNIYVIEKNPKAQVDAALAPEEAAKKLLPRSDIAVFTGATIVNHSFETLLALCTAAREVVFLGPTCSMIPEPLFDHGVTLMGGLRVYDGDRVLRVVSEGGSGNHFYESCATKTTIVRADRQV